MSDASPNVVWSRMIPVEQIGPVPGPIYSRGGQTNPHSGRHLEPRRRRLALVDLALRVLLALALLVFLVLAVVPHTGWYHAETVLSGSMKPYFSPGDLIVVTREPARDVRVGQVISYHIPTGDHHVQTHRVVAVVRRGNHPLVQTKGDANEARDPWTARLNGSTVWKVRLVVPRAGSLIVWMRNPIVRIATVFLAPLLFALLALKRIWRGSKEDAPDEQARVARLD